MAIGNPSGAEMGILQLNLVNIMAADALAPCVARSSAAMILIVCNVDILVFLGGEFQQPTIFHSLCEGQISVSVRKT